MHTLTTLAEAVNTGTDGLLDPFEIGALIAIAILAVIGLSALFGKRGR